MNSVLYRIWGNNVNHLERFTEKSLREVLFDHSKQFCCHYGAVMGLYYLGTQVCGPYIMLCLMFVTVFNSV